MSPGIYHFLGLLSECCRVPRDDQELGTLSSNMVAQSPTKVKGISFSFSSLLFQGRNSLHMYLSEADIKQKQDLELLKHFKGINPGTLKIISVSCLWRMLFKTDSGENFITRQILSKY